MILGSSRKLAVLLALASALGSGTATAVTVQLHASEDTTLFSQGNDLGNGAGHNLFVGNTSKNAGVRRSLLRFDFLAAGIPADAQISSVSLRLVMDQTSDSRAESLSLYRLATSWGEGTAASAGGGGATAGADDATWTHRFYQDGTGPRWDTPGGDASALASATTPVALPGVYLWSSDRMETDVRDWLSAPASNAGWLLVGNEADLGTAKRLLSSEGGEAAGAPTLSITFAPVPEPENFALMTAGLVLTGLVRWRRRSRRDTARAARSRRRP